MDHEYARAAVLFAPSKLGAAEERQNFGVTWLCPRFGLALAALIRLFYYHKKIAAINGGCVNISGQSSRPATPTQPQPKPVAWRL